MIRHTAASSSCDYFSSSGCGFYIAHVIIQEGLSGISWRLKGFPEQNSYVCMMIEVLFLSFRQR